MCETIFKNDCANQLFQLQFQCEPQFFLYGCVRENTRDFSRVFLQREEIYYLTYRYSIKCMHLKYSVGNI